MYISRKVGVYEFIFSLSMASLLAKFVCLYSEYFLTTLLGTPAAIEGFIRRRLIKPADDFTRAISWVKQCRTFHSDCNKENGRSFTPTRLIEVRSPLSTGELLRVRLISGRDATGEYASLSHCWGLKPVIQTTKESIHQFLTEIPWSDLSKTFQDAIEITRALAIPYLWIDSLCIVQDDYHDWERESANMGDVYAFAFLNIAAAASSDGSGGCFIPRKGLINQVNMNYFDHSGKPAGSVVVSPYSAETFLGYGPRWIPFEAGLGTPRKEALCAEIILRKRPALLAVYPRSRTGDGSWGYCFELRFKTTAKT
jgi:hypothetical protein